jgi:CDP-glycerol glycerophosphotransferase (TagB/SpsB family)
MAKWNAYVGEINPNNVVLYAPTKHYGLNVGKDDPAVDFFPFNDFDKKQLFKSLKTTNTMLLFRPHPATVRNMYDAEFGPHYFMKMQLMELCEECEYIRMATQYEFADTTELLHFVDILVTDYSSIYHDFLLLDRPILFVPYDYQAFERARGFSYDYYEYLPGPELSSFADFQSELSDIQDGVDRYQAKRRRLRNLIHKHQDGHARERLTKLIIDLCIDNTN